MYLEYLICFLRYLQRLVQSAYILNAFSCCRPHNYIEVQKELNLGSIVYFDFEINEFPEERNTNLLLINNEQTQIVIIIIKQEKQFIYSINYEFDKFQKVNYVELGIFQQVLLTFDSGYINIEWISDFQTIYQDRFPASQQNIKIIKYQDYICQLQTKNINQFLKTCEDDLSINMQLHPMIQYLHSQTFNNNYYKISFWVKQLSQGSETMDVQILDQHFGKRILIIISWKQSTFYFDDILIMRDYWQNDGWTLFQLTYQIKNGQFLYQRDDYFNQLNISQNFQYQVRLMIKPHKNIIFTEALLQISHNINNNLCVPGCLLCDQQGYCQQCGVGYIKQEHFCECQHDYQYYFSPSECYKKLDYEIKSVIQTRKQCPTFAGQICPQCEDQGNQHFNYCLFATNIQLYQQQLMLDFNYYHLYIQYESAENEYIIGTISELEQLYYSNIIYYKYYAEDIFLLGKTYRNNMICFNGYYYNNICKKQMKGCQIQFKKGQCEKCLENYFVLNGKCEQCPAHCEVCQIINYQIQCLKCVQEFFLNFQRSCIPCLLQDCGQCYHYNGNFNTLERNFKTEKLNFNFQLGCSFCKQDSTLQMESRECKQQGVSKYITLNDKMYEENFKIIDFLEKLEQFCQDQFKQCKFCQNSQCIACQDEYIFDNQNNNCIPQSKNIKIYKFNQKLKDHEIHFNLFTFLYFNYSYIDIIKHQQQYYLINCQFNNFLEKFEATNIYCDRDLLYLTNSYKQCQFYCEICLMNKTCLIYKQDIQFNINFTLQYINKIFELENFNSYVHNMIEFIKYFEQKTYQINIIIMNQIKPLTSRTLANILNHYPSNDINIQFNNFTIFENQYLFIEDSINIINSQFNIFQNFTIRIQLKNKGSFLLRNVIFTGQTNSSNLQFSINSSSAFTIQNVIVENFSFLTFFVLSESLIIKNLTLRKLNLTEKNDYSIVFPIQSNNINITNLNIHNSRFRKIKVFQIQYNTLQIQNVKVFQVFFEESRLIRFFQSQKDTMILSHLLMKSIISYNSRLFQFGTYNTQEEISICLRSVIISNSKLFNSSVFESPLQIDQLKTLYLTKFAIKFNFIQNSTLLQFSPQSITAVKIHLSYNFIQYIYSFMILATQIIQFNYFLDENDIYHLGSLADINSQRIISFSNMLLKNCSFNNDENDLQTNNFLFLSTLYKITISNFYLIDISTSISLIEFHLAYGEFDIVI